MTNEPQTYYALVKMVDVTGEEADEIITNLEDNMRPPILPDGEPVGEQAVFVTHAPELWTVMLDGPVELRVELYATEAQCWKFLIQYVGDEHEHYGLIGATPAKVIDVLSRYGYVTDVKRHDYPVHPA